MVKRHEDSFFDIPEKIKPPKKKKAEPVVKPRTTLLSVSKPEPVVVTFSEREVTRDWAMNAAIKHLDALEMLSPESRSENADVLNIPPEIKHRALEWRYNRDNHLTTQQ